MPRAVLPKLRPDADIAQDAVLRPMTDVAAELDLKPDEIDLYGRGKAKVRLEVFDRLPASPRAKLILVTAMTATKAGAGKTVTSIGLAQALRSVGERVALCLREPSLGPTFGIKGGAAGGGNAQVVPMEDINLHFTGDIHAVTAAHNLLSAVVDNLVHFKTVPGFSAQGITWRRVLDLCDRQLRSCEIGLGGKGNGFPHPAGFDITASSEIMAVLALASSRKDLAERLGRIVVGRRDDGTPMTARECDVVGALEVLLKDALAPNLVQTVEGGPALIHAGPFANIAHGCNSVLATKLGLGTADYVVTEAGFAADLGAEKFMHIKSPALGVAPAAAVLVVNARALKMHGGVAYDQLAGEDVDAVMRGFVNARTHLENLRHFGLPVVVAVNRFNSDTDAELDAIVREFAALNAVAVISEVAHFGGPGGHDLARAVIEAAKAGNRPVTRLYKESDSIEDKIKTIATQIYRSDGVDFAEEARADIELLRRDGHSELPVCMAKTQHSISDDAALLGSPRGWRLTVRRVRVSAGAGFLVATTGDILLMPGMPRESSAAKISIDENGRVHGLS